jgi:lysyl-tRNA synthetase class 2
MGAPATDGVKADVVRERHLLLRVIRDFFDRRGYFEVETPYLNRTAPPDPYIEPLRVFVGGAGPYYLHTSPEIGMKKLIARGHGKIFQVCKAFRVEELEEHHSVEFTMLEWYMPGTYVEAMAETADLVREAERSLGAAGAAVKSGPWPAYAIGDLFIEAVGFDPLPLDRASLFASMEGRGFRGLSASDAWEDLFFRCFVQEVEPLIRKKGEGPFFVKDWPASLTAMARKKDDRTAERFELYMGGLEIANGYTELLDAKEQLERIARDNAERKRLGRETFHPDGAFLDALDSIRGPVAGVSVGVDRLQMALCGKKSIGDVLPDRLTLGGDGPR